MDHVNSAREPELRTLVTERFGRAGIPIQSLAVRDFPGETIVVVEVSSHFDEAIALASEIDPLIPSGFVSVRRAAEPRKIVPSRATGVHDPKVTSLIELLNSRSRTSEAQPSLQYVNDAAEHLGVVVAPRHHLVFGRRGVGKTALMVEAKRAVEERGDATVWLNLQPLRTQEAHRVFLAVLARVLETPDLRFLGRKTLPRSVHDAAPLIQRVRTAMSGAAIDYAEIENNLLPQAQQVCRLFTAETQSDLFVFLDDVHYLNAAHVPKFLDLVHGLSRDTKLWLKVAAVRHQTRWFAPAPPMGLQAGHDAQVVDLDVTLEEPRKVKDFLERVLGGYLEAAGISAASGFLAAAGFDRLVLAAGGVPRDFFTLCAEALQSARQRTSATRAGVQDVNNASGRTAGSKLQELENDAGAAVGSSRELVSALDDIKRFLLDEQGITFFQIDLREKDRHTKEYALIQGLMDLRMLHMVNSSLSARDEAGRRSEVYMLDLSQYSGSRLKQNLWVLDFEGGHLLLRRTRTKQLPSRGDTARRLITILRRGPAYPLTRLTEFSSKLPPLG
jgi:hypothetical protein